MAQVVDGVGRQPDPPRRGQPPERDREDQDEQDRDHERGQRQQAEAAKNTANQAYPDTTFGAVWRQEFGKETLRARYFGSAHTGGDSVVVFEQANVAHVGDLVFNHRHPRIDRPGGGSVRSWINVLEQTTRNLGTQTLYVFGHAAEGHKVTGTRDDLFMTSGSQIVHYDGDSVTAQLDMSVLAMTGAGDDVWAVGYGEIAHYDGSTWEMVSCPVPNELAAVWAASSSDAWAAGPSVLLHWAACLALRQPAL